MNLYDITRENACAAKIRAETGEEVISAIAHIAASLPVMRKVSEAEITAGLMEREQQGSTGFGGGMAIPHARFEHAEDFAFFIVTLRKGIAFKAIDGKKVRVFFVLLGPERRVRDHLRILATISNIISHSNVVRELQAASSSSALYEIFLSKLSAEEQPQDRREKVKLLIVVLYEEDLFYDLLDFFLEAGLDGATVIDSAGMGRFISKMPLFASYIGFMNEQKNDSRTLLLMVPEERLPVIIRGIEAITGDLDSKQGAMVMALDVAFNKGSMQML